MSILQQLQALPVMWVNTWRERLPLIRHNLNVIIWRAKNPVQASFELGNQLMDRRLYHEAILRYRFVVWRRPAFAAAWYNLALCYLARKESGKGMEALNKAIALDPKDEMALYLKASYEEGRFAGDTEPHTTPLPLLKNEFAPRAHRYELAEMDKGYRAQIEMMRQLLALKLPMGDVLDAGCGSGACSLFLSVFANSLTGVDAVPEMLREAQRRRGAFYTQLIQADLRDHLLQSRAPAYDLIAAIQVLPLVGGLAAVFDGVTKSLRPGGIFIFTAYPFKAAEGYRFDSTTRHFEHSLHYLKSQAERTNLTVVSLRDIPLYDSDTRPVALLMTLRKP